MCVPCVGAVLHWIVAHLDRGAVTTSQAKPPSAGTHFVQSPKVLREAGVAKVLDAAISRTDQVWLFLKTLNVQDYDWLL